MHFVSIYPYRYRKEKKVKKLMEKLGELLELGGTKKDITLLTISAASLLVSLFAPAELLPFNAAWISVILCGVPIVLEALIGLITAFDIKADVLVSIALIASVCIGEDFAAGEVAFIMQLGGLLEELTVKRARAGIERLVHLTPRTARLISDGHERTVPAEEVKKGDILRVLPGETIAVDGVIISGQTSVNQAVMTGESLPVDKTVGDEVSSGTVNQLGAFDMRAEKVGEDSSIQRMIRLVQSADAGKAKIVGIADRWATWIVIIALTAAALTWIFSGEIIRAVTILVVFCPCALVLATPTAIMAAIGNATKHGFLVREGDALERLAAVDMIAFDKTGTLTKGIPEVAEIVTNGEISSEELLSLAASAESMSEHPLGKAIVSEFRRRSGAEPTVPESFEMNIGKGISAVVAGRRILAGNEKLLALNGIAEFGELSKKAEKFLSDGCTVIYIAESAPLGFIVLSDTLRAESSRMIADICAAGITPLLLTGDNENAAAAIGSRVGISEIRSGCLPEDKLNCIKAYGEQGRHLCMIGDGINDAPALKIADVGIAMGKTGSDIAVDAADIALVDDEVKELPHLLALSKRMMTTIKFNLSFSMGLNFLAIALAITGVLNPVVGALVHNAGSVFVIINSAFLLKWKKRVKGVKGV